MNNLRKLPLVDQQEVDLETLEAELAMANTRVVQATRRRDEILAAALPAARQRAINQLEKRGIELRKTKVVVSHRCWKDDVWKYDVVFVKDVEAKEKWGGLGGEMEIDIEYHFARIKKDGTPSKSSPGLGYHCTIERVAEEQNENGT